MAASITGKRREGASFAALLAVFALLVQALLPSAAIAAQSRGADGEAIVICTQMGVQVIRPDNKPTPAKGFAGLPCQDCLAAAGALVLTASPAALRVVYAVEHIRTAPVRRSGVVLARIPPRPPSQAPPANYA